MQPEQPQPYVYQEPEQNDPGKRKRIILGVSGLIVFVFIVIIVVILIFSGPNHRVSLGEITAKQQEVVRVSELGLNSDRARTSTKAFAANSQAAAATHVAKLSGHIDENYGQPLADATLESAENSTIDTALETAEQNSVIDSKFVEIMKSLLSDSNAAIEEQSAIIEDQATLDVLNEIYQDNSILLESI